MKGIAARPVLGEQMRTDQLFQQVASLSAAQAGETGGGRDADVGTRVHAKQPEHAGRFWVQRPIGPGEHGPGIGDAVSAGQGVEPAADVAEFAGQGNERVPRAQGRLGGGDVQCQRQPGAQADELLDRLRFGGRPPGAQATGQQRPGIVVLQQVKEQRLSPFDRDQAGQLIAAGDQDQAAGSARQQRPHLPGIASVVEQDEHALAGQPAAVQIDLRVHCRGDGRRRYPDRVQEPADRRRGIERGAGRVEAAQVDVQLPVGVALRDLMRPVHGQGSLAHARGPGDRRDHHGARGGQRPIRDCVQHRQLIGPADKMRGGTRQLARHVGIATTARTARVHRDRESWIGAQDPLVQFAQLRARFRTQLIDQHPASALIGGERLALTAIAVQREHQQGVQPLTQRMLYGKLFQLDDDLVMPAQVQVRIDPRLDGLQPHLCQPGLLPQRQELRRDVGQRLASPQRQPGAQQARRLWPTIRGAPPAWRPRATTRICRHLVRLGRPSTNTRPAEC